MNGQTDFERQLTERLEAAAPPSSRGLRDRISQAVESTPQRRGSLPWLAARAPEMQWTRIGAWTAVALVALVVGIGIGSSGLVGIGGRPTASPSANTATAPPASATPIASLPASTAYSSWLAIDVPDPTPHVYGGEQASDVVAFGGGYVAVGFINGGCCDGGYTTDTRAVVWRSQNGTTWSLEPHRPEFALGRMVAAATDGKRVVVVGYRVLQAATGEGELHGAVWFSTDGQAWQLVSAGVPELYSVSWFDGHFLGAANTDAGPELWSSVDGAGWSRQASSFKLGRGWINAIRRTQLGLIAVGREQSSDTPVLWTSPDGIGWRRFAAESFGHGVMTDVAVGGDDLVIVGFEGGDSGAHVVFWRSTDGIAWDRVDAPSFVVDASEPPTIIVTERGFVVVALVTVSASGRSNAFLRAWTSADGATWSAVPDPPPSESRFAISVGGISSLKDGRLVIMGAGPGDPSHNQVPAGAILGP